jgi:hypothetical protein
MVSMDRRTGWHRKTRRGAGMIRSSIIIGVGLVLLLIGMWGLQE